MRSPLTYPCPVLESGQVPRSGEGGNTWLNHIPGETVSGGHTVGSGPVVLKLTLYTSPGLSGAPLPALIAFLLPLSLNPWAAAAVASQAACVNRNVGDISTAKSVHILEPGPGHSEQAADQNSLRYKFRAPGASGRALGPLCKYQCSLLPR